MSRLLQETLCTRYRLSESLNCVVKTQICKLYPSRFLQKAQNWPPLLLAGGLLLLRCCAVILPLGGSLRHRSTRHGGSGDLSSWLECGSDDEATPSLHVCRSQRGSPKGGLSKFVFQTLCRTCWARLTGCQIYLEEWQMLELLHVTSGILSGMAWALQP